MIERYLKTFIIKILSFIFIKLLLFMRFGRRSATNISYKITKDGDILSNVANTLGLTLDEIITTNKNIYLLPEQLIVYRK